MAWQIEMVRLLRNLINDVATPYTYSDSRLEELVLASAHIVIQSHDFSTTYTVDIDESILSPDPTTGTKDNDFIVLTVLKAGCLVDSSLLRSSAATGGIAVKDGPSSIDTKGTIAAYQYIFDRALCKEYQDASKQYAMTSTVGGHMILTPFSSDNVWFGRGDSRSKNFH